MGLQNLLWFLLKHLRAGDHGKGLGFGVWAKQNLKPPPPLNERLPKPAGGASGRNMRGVAVQVFPSLYGVLASALHA